MNITIDSVNNRIKVLQGELDDVLSKANAISGAIQDCEYWIIELNKEESIDKEEPINND